MYKHVIYVKGCTWPPIFIKLQKSGFKKYFIAKEMHKNSAQANNTKKRFVDFLSLSI